MAISIKNQAKYDRLYDELKLNMAGPYAQEVKNILFAKDILVTERQVYNVVRGHKKDFTILYALREFFGLPNDMDEKQSKMKLAKTQKINLSQ